MRPTRRRSPPPPPPLRCLWKPSAVVVATTAATDGVKKDSTTETADRNSAVSDSKVTTTTTPIQLISYDDIYNYYCILPPIERNSTTTIADAMIESKTKSPQYSHPRYSLFRYISNALLVVQEFILVCYFLAWYRIFTTPISNTATTSSTTTPMMLLQQQQSRQYYIDASMICMYIALLMAVILNARAGTILEQSTGIRERPKKTHRYYYYHKVVYRTIDATILAGMVRYIAILLRNLTVSYSTDTVERLAVLAMFVHVLCCDYSYANGYDANHRRVHSALKHPKPKICDSNEFRPTNHRGDSQYTKITSTFRGGTISLNAAFFAAILLVSRFDTTAMTDIAKGTSTVATNTTFMFISLAVILFAFYPVTRHTISIVYPSHESGTTLFVSLSHCLLIRDKGSVSLFIF